MNQEMASRDEQAGDIMEKRCFVNDNIEGAVHRDQINESVMVGKVAEIGMNQLDGGGKLQQLPGTPGQAEQLPAQIKAEKSGVQLAIPSQDAEVKPAAAAQVKNNGWLQIPDDRQGVAAGETGSDLKIRQGLEVFGGITEFF